MKREETSRIQLTYPKQWNKKLDALKDLYGALNRQDVIRTVVASVLFPEECVHQESHLGFKKPFPFVNTEKRAEK